MVIDLKLLGREELHVASRSQQNSAEQLCSQPELDTVVFGFETITEEKRVAVANV